MVKHRHQIAYDVVLVLLPSTLLGSTAGVFLNKVRPSWLSMLYVCCMCAACLHVACVLRAYCMCTVCALHVHYQMCPNWLIMLLLVLLCGYSGKRTLSKGFQQ